MECRALGGKEVEEQAGPGLTPPYYLLPEYLHFQLFIHSTRIHLLALSAGFRGGGNTAERKSDHSPCAHRGYAPVAWTADEHKL